MKHEKGFWFFMVPKRKSGVERVWSTSTTTFCCWGCAGKRNLPHEIGLPRWELPGAEEGSQWSMGRGLGCHPFWTGIIYNHIGTSRIFVHVGSEIYGACVCVCELVHMTCFASVGAQKTAEVLCHWRGPMSCNIFHCTLQMTPRVGVF